MSQIETESGQTVGRVISIQNNYYYVQYDNETWTCFLKGNLKKETRQNPENAVMVGDWVELDSIDNSNQSARIVEPVNRNNHLLRPKVANVDKAVIVYPAKEPEFDPVQVDRYLAKIKLANLIPVLCISKCDLIDETDSLKPIITFYQDALKISVYNTSIHQESSIKPLLDALKNTISVLAGPSGAGKSSILNTVKPELDLEVKEVSEKIGRGQHTTRHVSLIELSENTLVADTPGFSHLNFDDILPQDIQALYPEFDQFNCDFSDCLHREEETGCAVRGNLNSILPSRWESYQAILQDSLKHKQVLQESSSKDEYGHKTLNKKGEKDLKILKLKSKDRSGSRRTRRQELSTLVDDYLNDEDE